jgi:hypothetical protein
MAAKLATDRDDAAKLKLVLVESHLTIDAAEKPASPDSLL